MAESTPVDESHEEPRGRDLLPPDPPVQEPELRRIGERRVVGWRTTQRLWTRRTRRPAGNSRRFWARMEEDDPFLPRVGGARGPDILHDRFAPAERLSRLPQSAPQRPASKPKPRAREVSASGAHAVHTPEPRPVPPPTPAARPPVSAPPPSAPPAAAARPAPAPPPAAPPAPPRQEGTGSRTGRVRIQRATRVPPPQVEAAPSPAQIRAAKKQQRGFGTQPPPPPRLRSLDEVLGLLGELQVAEQLYEAGIKDPDEDAGSAMAPPVDHTPPRPATAPPVDRRPPRVATATPVDRTPPRPATARQAEPTPAPEPQGGLDDLFGGASNDRVRIGRRTRSSGPVVETHED